MAVFTVTFRKADGGVTSEIVDAVNREECRSKVITRGYSVIKIQQGDLLKEQNRFSGISPIKLMAVVTAVVLLGLGAWYLTSSARSGDDMGVERIKKVEESAPKDKKVKSSSVVASNAVESSAMTGKTAAHKDAEPGRTEGGLSSFEQSLTNCYKAAQERKIVFIPNKRRTERIFQEVSDRQIQRLLTLVPGRIFLSSEKYDNFAEDFRKSLKTPIVIEPSDSEQVRQIKEAVIETRKDLEKRMRAGEDIAKVMAETEAELKRLGRYRFNLETEIKKARANGTYGEADMHDFVDAANAMLKENNLPELKFPELWYRNTKIQQSRNLKKENVK